VLQSAAVHRIVPLRPLIERAGCCIERTHRCIERLQCPNVRVRRRSVVRLHCIERIPALHRDDGSSHSPAATSHRASATMISADSSLHSPAATLQCGRARAHRTEFLLQRRDAVLAEGQCDVADARCDVRERRWALGNELSAHDSWKSGKEMALCRPGRTEWDEARGFCSPRLGRCAGVRPTSHREKGLCGVRTAPWSFSPVQSHRREGKCIGGRVTCLSATSR